MFCLIFAIHSLDILTSMGVFLPLFLNKSDHAHKNVRKNFSKPIPIAIGILGKKRNGTEPMK